MVTECDVLSPSAKSQKRGGTASVNYLKVKNGVAYWKMIIPDRKQIHAAPNVLLLGSQIASLCRNNLLHTTAPGYKGWRNKWLKGA